MADEAIDVFWHEGVLAHDTGKGVFEAVPSPSMAVDEVHPISGSSPYWSKPNQGHPSRISAIPASMSP